MLVLELLLSRFHSETVHSFQLHVRGVQATCPSYLLLSGLFALSHQLRTSALLFRTNFRKQLYIVAASALLVPVGTTIAGTFAIIAGENYPKSAHRN